MAEIWKGKPVAEKLNSNLLERSERLKNKGITPVLAVVCVGESPDDMAYERSIVKRCEKTGVEFSSVTFDQEVSQKELEEALDNLSRDDSVHGILVMRPLPRHFDDDEVRAHIDWKKDVDGITDPSRAAVFSDKDRGFKPCTAEACMEMLDFYGEELKGRKVVVVGRSQVIGKPVSMMLLRRHATVTICHSRTLELDRVCRDADIIVTATGRRNLITRDHVAPGQRLIDVSINFDEDGRMCGDTDFEAVKDVVAAITPVPGGVGGVTTGILLRHVIESAEGRSCR